MSEELKHAIKQVRDNLERDFADGVPGYIRLRKDLAEMILSAMPHPDAVATIVAPIDISHISALNTVLNQAYGPGLLVKYYRAGVMQVLKPQQPTQ